MKRWINNNTNLHKFRYPVQFRNIKRPPPVMLRMSNDGCNGCQPASARFIRNVGGIEAIRWIAREEAGGGYEEIDECCRIQRNVNISNHLPSFVNVNEVRFVKEMRKKHNNLVI